MDLVGEQEQRECSPIEHDLEYVVEDVWGTLKHSIAGPGMCCAECQEAPECVSWTWMKLGGKCFLKGGAPKSKVKHRGAVSGLLHRILPGRAGKPVPPPGAKPAPPPATPAEVCGPADVDVLYVVENVWSTIQGGIPNPATCCTHCQEEKKCQAWTWEKDGNKCMLKGGTPEQKVPHEGSVSGLVPRSRGAPRPGPPRPGPPHGGPRCGPVEQGLNYVVGKVWGDALKSPSPLACCELCGRARRCMSWTWVKKGGQCLLHGGAPTKKVKDPGCASGIKVPQHPVPAGGLPHPGPRPGPPPGPRPGPHPGAPGDVCRPNEKPWKHQATGPVLPLKVLTYNLYWWRLFDQGKPAGFYKTNPSSGASALELIVRTAPYDMMGFQECEDEGWVLGHAHLAAHYTIFRDRGCCMAFRKMDWALMSRGVKPVAKDNYGLRPAQWMRLRHITTGRMVFFMNHHGPIPINSGGQWGEVAAATKILQAIKENADPDDAVVVVGDFNANQKGQTIQHLVKCLHRLYDGSFDGGIDHVLGNLSPMSVARRANLGKGGSDHDALSVTIRLGR